MTRTGRPRNLRLRLALLERLPRESVGEILRSGSFSRPQLAHYLREMRREGLIEPSRYFSHLPEDGPGAKRYVVTRKGRSRRQVYREYENSALARRVIPESEPPAPPAGVAPRTGPPATKPSSSPSSSVSTQVYLGLHNLAYSMTVEASFRRPFHWERSYAMGNGSWVKRHSPFGRGIHLEESGGSRYDAPGAAGHKLTVKFRVRGPDAVTNEARAYRIANGVRRTLEMEYGCTLSEPVLVSLPKHSFKDDPFARALTSAGVSVHGEVGVDKSPEREGTLEIRSGETAKRYAEGLARVPELLERIAEMEEKLGAMLEAETRLAGAVEKIAERLTPPKPSPPPPPLSDLSGSGYG